MTYVNSCGALGGGALIACFPVHGIGCPPVIVIKLPAEERGQQFLYVVEKVFPSTDPGGWLKISNRCPI